MARTEDEWMDGLIDHPMTPVATESLFFLFIKSNRFLCIHSCLCPPSDLFFLLLPQQVSPPGLIEAAARPELKGNNEKERTDD